MTAFITSIDEITPEWLTETLRGAGVLTAGRVAGVGARAMDTTTANAFPLQLRYSDDAPPGLPESLFLKIGRRYSEVAFYNRVLPHTHDIPVIQCYAATFANDLGQSNLLMADISATHAEPPDALPLPLATAEQCMDIVARLHAQWWESPRFTGELRDVMDDVPGFILRQAQGGLSHFLDMLGDRLPEKRRRWYERIVAGLPLPEWQERMKTNRGITLVHGDTHWWNFMLPRADGDILLADWAVWHVNLGVSDLAYTFGQVCYRGWREQHEERLVRYYHGRLQGYGVTGYDWEQCWRDYRLAHVFHTLWPIFHHRWAPNALWWRGLECCMAAFEDLGCEEFLS